MKSSNSENIELNFDLNAFKFFVFVFKTKKLLNNCLWIKNGILVIETKQKNIIIKKGGL